MSLNKDALELIIENAISASGEEKAADFPIAMLPSNMTVHNLEPYMKQRNQFRGTLHTHSIVDFVEYTNQQNTGSCFIDREAMGAEAIFDIGSIEAPGHCRHSAELHLNETAAYNAIRKIDGKRLTQADLAEFIEDWPSAVMYINMDGEPAMASKAAAAAIRDVTVKENSESSHQVQTFSTQKSAMEQLDASSQNKPLPGFMCFKCKPYDGLSSYELVHRISMIIRKGDAPLFVVRSVNLEETREEMSNELIDLVCGPLLDSINPYLGTFDSSG